MRRQAAVPQGRHTGERTAHFAIGLTSGDAFALRLYLSAPFPWGLLEIAVPHAVHWPGWPEAELG